MAVFLDASYLVALADRTDPWHADAVALQRDVAKRGRPHTHALVLAEVVALVGSSNGGKAARTAYHALRDGTEFHLPTGHDLDAAMQDVVRFDGTLSLADALCLVVMREHSIRAIASFDRDFDGKGVERLH